MKLSYLSIAASFILIFNILPILGNFEDARLFVKILSILIFILGVWTFFETRFHKSSNQIHNDKLPSEFKKEIFFTIYLISILSFCYLYTVFQHLDSFFLVDYDFLAISEILNNSLSGNFFRTHHYGMGVTGNYLAHHFSPSILILSPFLFLSELRLGYAYGLLFFFCLSYILFAILLLKRNIRGNLFYFSMILLSCNLYLHRLFFSYHFELLIVPGILLFFVGKEFNKNYLSVLSVLFLLLLKEDMAIYLFCLGGYFLLQANWKYSISLLLISSLYFSFIPSFFQSFLNSSTHVDWLTDWGKWGNSYREIALNVIIHPIQVIEIFFSKWKILRDFLLSFSPLILVSPSVIIVSLPIFLIHFISDRIWYNSLYNYYSYSVVSFFILSIIFSIEKIQSSKYERYSLSILIFCLSISLYFGGDKSFPYSKIEIDKERANAVKEVISQIPKDKTLATQFDLGGFVKRTNPIYPLHEKNLDKDFLLIDNARGITPYVNRLRIENMIRDVLEKKVYTLESEKNGILLYKKN